MAIPQPPHSAAVTLITPECEFLDCGVGGDQYTKVRCRGCQAWFCPAPSTLKGLANYEGLCLACLQVQQRSPYQ